MRYFWIALLLSSPVYAAVELNAEIEWGNQLFRPLVVVPDGKSVKLAQADLLVELFAEPVEHGAAVRIRAEVVRVEKDKTIPVGKPTIIARWNEPAEIRMTETSGSHRFRLKVIASQID